MSLTNLLAELIVVGVCGLYWLLAFTNEFIMKINYSQVFKSELKSTVIFFAFLYFFGMTINFVSDRLFAKIDRLIAKEYGGKEKIQKLRSVIISKNEESVKYLFQRRSFVRIFRANSLNFLLISTVVFFDIGNLSSLCDCDIKTNRLAFVSLTISAISLWAYKKTLSGYFKYIKDAGGITNEL